MPVDQIAIANSAADRMAGYIQAGVSRATDPEQIDRFLSFAAGVNNDPTTRM